MWISNVRIVLADAILPTGALRIEEGQIAELRDVPVKDAQIEGEGLLLTPGLIDMHGDMIEHALEPRVGVDIPLELTWRNLDRLLKVSGVTTAYASFSFHPRVADGQLQRYEQSKAAIKALQTLRAQLAVDHKVHARFELGFPRAYEIVSELVSAGLVELVSLMDHTEGQEQARDIERLTQSGKDAGKPRTETTDVLETMEKLVSVCRNADVCLASHDDDTAAKVATMKRFGVQICEFPETLEAAQAGRDTGQWTVMGAPNVMRGKSHSGNLSGRDAHAAGLLDMLASDYLPSAILPAVLILAQTDPDRLPGALRKATLTPAQALGLADRGEIAIGKRADLILASDSGVGGVYATFVEGRLVYRDGSPGARAFGQTTA